jgi:hypothetical protein
MKISNILSFILIMTWENTELLVKFENWLLISKFIQKEFLAVDIHEREINVTLNLNFFQWSITQKKLKLAESE